MTVRFNIEPWSTYRWYRTFALSIGYAFYEDAYENKNNFSVFVSVGFYELSIELGFKK